MESCFPSGHTSDFRFDTFVAILGCALVSRVLLGLFSMGILIDVSSPVHDPHCAGEILFLYRYPCEVFCTEENNRSLWESPHARERAMDVLCRSPFAWCCPAHDQT